jgi:hypothetical protein
VSPARVPVLCDGQYVVECTTSGGKAGKGCSTNASLLVFWKNDFGWFAIGGYIRYSLLDAGSYEAALAKARKRIAADRAKGP